jgi:hypothetical protein
MAVKIQVAANHDFRVRACLDYAHYSWKLHRNPKTEQIKPIADFFRGRCARLRALMQLPAQVGNVTIKLRDNYMRSIFDVTGGLDIGNVTPEQREKIDLRSNEIFTDHAEEMARLKESDGWDAHVHKSLVDGLVAVELMGREPQSISMLQASMMSYLTTGWTIIETMSGDLWETALNAHPSTLANLTGSPKRLKGAQINKSSQRAKESKSVQLDEISKHRFEVANKMGTILRAKFDFASLDGIREAYACAFTEAAAQIDRALIDTSLDALSAIRNLIVHRDANADSEYLKKMKALSSLPKVEIGQHILLNGDIVVRLLKPAITTANQLLIAVDDWLAKPARQA